MPITQQYADLAKQVYDEPNANIVYRENQRPTLSVGGKKYEVYEHASNPRTGYQGTVYREMPNGEFIVAHRGTEPPGKDIKDMLSDTAMVNSRTNIQANDALALTKRAQAYAEDAHDKNPNLRIPAVTVTGHSLGGTLAQITAHHYGLGGQAFNPYGAASLDRHIVAGKGNFVNHVMAGDTVSAASQHYGQVKVYASRQDVEAIKRHDLIHKASDLQVLTRISVSSSVTIATAASLLGDHSIHNFTGHEGKNNILRDAEAGRRAADNWTAIDHYRDEVANNRKAIGAATISPAGVQNLWSDVIHGLKNPEQKRTAEPESKPYMRSDATDILVPNTFLAQADHPRFDATQQAQLNWAHGLVEQNPRFDSFNTEQKQTIALGVMTAIADSKQDINKLQLITLAPDGVTVAAKLDSQPGLATLPLHEALKTEPQHVVQAQAELGNYNQQVAMQQAQVQAQSQGQRIT